MRAAILGDVREIATVEVPTPTLGDADVLIEVAATGVCGSDVHAYRGRHPFRTPPVILGHEVSGSVVAAGPSVRGIAPGDRVVVEPQAGCGDCALCRSGRYHLCPYRRSPGAGEWLGSFAEYFAAPAAAVHHVPDALSWEVAALVEPLAVGYHAVGVSGTRATERVAIVGAGSIGLSVLLALGSRGVEQVATIDISPRKLETASALGATSVDARADDLVGAVTDALGGAADVVVVTADYPSVLADALALTGPQGRVTVLSLFEEEVVLDANALVLAERQVRGSFVYVREDFVAVLESLEADANRAAMLVTHTMPLEDAGRALRTLDGGAEDAIKIILTGPAYEPRG